MSAQPLRISSPEPSNEKPPRRQARELRPLAVCAKRLARLLSAGVRSVRAWDASGKLPRPVKIGGRVVWVVSEIRAWLEAGAPRRDEWEARKRAAGK